MPPLSFPTTRGANVWQCGRFCVNLQQPKVMGIVNCTPDSFSDGGQCYTARSALRHAEKLLRHGADMLDVGGESTRPGALRLDPDDEWARVAHVLRELCTWDVPITLDTRSAVVMRRALDEGWVDGINDISALRDPDALNVLAQHADIGICLMHMQGTPETMQSLAHYEDPVLEVGTYLRQRQEACLQAGINLERIVIDPGFGFGKTLEHNMTLLRELPAWRQIAGGRPVLVGVSRKSMIGLLTGQKTPSTRVVGSVVAAVAAVLRSAAIVRVHDVLATCQGLKVWAALGATE